MQTTLDSILTRKRLFGVLIGVTTVILVANLFGEDAAILVGNLSYIPIAGSLLVLSFLILRRFGSTGYHGTAWISFMGYALSAFIAEMLWIIQELYLKIDPFPSAADVFYFVSYPFLLLFYVSYFHPVRRAITKKSIYASVAISTGILVPSLILAIGPVPDTNFLTLVMGAAYPIFDAMVLVPAMIGVYLFFNGKVNFMWTLFCLGTISVFIGDVAFLLGQSESTYYTGNPLEIPFYWNYILLSFGVFSQLKLFQNEKTRENLK